jgi:rhodanese-related sulfurtransferase
LKTHCHVRQRRCAARLTDVKDHDTVLARALRQALLIVAVSGMLGIISNALAPWRIPWLAEPCTLAAVVDSSLLGVGVEDAGADSARAGKPLAITLVQAKTLFDRRQAIFVDARPAYEFHEGHVAGSVNVPWEEVEYYGADIERLPRDSTVVVYCAGESCDLSIHLGEHLARLGFSRVRVFLGGWLEWKGAGYPVDKN